MATLATVTSTVLAFGQTNTFTSSPATIDDTIVPAPGAMNSRIFQDFFGALGTAVAGGGITCNLPVQCVKDAAAWMDIVDCVFFNQTGGVLG